MNQEELILWGVGGLAALITLYVLWVKILKPTFAFLGRNADKIKAFFITWVVVILLNQIFIFGACFAPYCIAAALPHTSAIAALLTYFYFKSEQVST